VSFAVNPDGTFQVPADATSGFAATCGCCGGENCVCEHECTSPYQCGAWLCPTCVPCSFKVTVSGVAGQCSGVVDAPAQSVSVCASTQDLGGGECSWTFHGTTRTYSRRYVNADCTGLFTKVCGLDVSLAFSGGPDADHAHISVIVHFGEAVVFQAEYVHGPNVFDWGDFPVTIANGEGLSLDPDAQPYGGTVTLAIECCGPCVPTSGCPVDCRSCCLTIKPTFAAGGVPCVFGDVPKLFSVDDGTSCRWQSSSVYTNGRWIAFCDSVRWIIQFVSLNVLCSRGYQIMWWAPIHGESCITDATGWELVRDDFCNAPDLIRVVCDTPDGCEGCPSPDCSGCRDGSWFLSGALPESGPDAITTIGASDKCNQSFLQCSADVCVTVEIVCSGGTWTMTLTWTFTSGKVMVFQAPAILDPNGDADHADDCCWPADASRYTKTRDDFGSSIEITGTDF
jgi:hypothetical protein